MSPIAPPKSRTDRQKAQAAATAASNRPPIWVAGRQRPPFHLVAWLAVGLAMTRRWMAPKLAGISAVLAGLSTRIAGGAYRLPMAWAGPAARIIPSRRRVAGGVHALAAGLAEAGDILMPAPVTPAPVTPPPVTPGPVAHPDLNRGNSGPAAVAAKRLHPAHPEGEQSALRALRAIMQEPSPQEHVPTQTPAAPSRAVSRLLAQGLAWGSLGLALPVGLVQALLFHLDGGDLKDWD